MYLKKKVDHPETVMSEKSNQYHDLLLYPMKTSENGLRKKLNKISEFSTTKKILIVLIHQSIRS